MVAFSQTARRKNLSESSADLAVLGISGLQGKIRNSIAGHPAWFYTVDLFLCAEYVLLTDISVYLGRNPPGFAFIEFEDLRDAEDACKDMNGMDFQDKRLRVEISRSRGRNSGPGGGGGGGGYGGGGTLFSFVPFAV